MWVYIPYMDGMGGMGLCVVWQRVEHNKPNEQGQKEPN